jgi:hypothetical protein
VNAIELGRTVYQSARVAPYEPETPQRDGVPLRAATPLSETKSSIPKSLMIDKPSRVQEAHSPFGRVPPNQVSALSLQRIESVQSALSERNRDPRNTHRAAHSSGTPEQADHWADRRHHERSATRELIWLNARTGVQNSTSSTAYKEKAGAMHTHDA